MGGWWVLAFMMFSLNNLFWYIIGKSAGEDLRFDHDDRDKVDE